MNQNELTTKGFIKSISIFMILALYRLYDVKASQAFCIIFELLHYTLYPRYFVCFYRETIIISFYYTSYAIKTNISSLEAFCINIKNIS